MARQARMERQLRAASGAVQGLLEEHFAMWRLTPAERDVALMAIEGFSIAGIAAPRQTGAAVKAQCAAVRAEGGAAGRPRLPGLFIDEVTDDGLAGAAPAGRRRVRCGGSRRAERR